MKLDGGGLVYWNHLVRLSLWMLLWQGFFWPALLVKACRFFFLTNWDQEKMARHFTDDLLKLILFNEMNIYILIEFSLKYVLKGPVNNKPLSEPIMV